jgi:hypothetical protein
MSTPYTTVNKNVKKSERINNGPPEKIPTDGI